MKRKFKQRRPSRRSWAAVLGLCAAAGAVSAADTNAPPALTPQQFVEGGEKSYDNWVDFSVGGFLANGSQPAAQRAGQSALGAFGGLDDFHYQAEVAKDTVLNLDGRGLAGDHNYNLKLGLVNEKLGYLKFSYDEYRTWYNGNGGYDPAAAIGYPLGGDALALDRGEFSVEGGLTKEGLPNVTFKYTRDFRDGDKSSTIWGGTHPAIGVNQGLSPSIYDIAEHSDSFQLDVTDHIKTTDFGAGVRYEFGKTDDALEIDQYPGEPVEQKITDRQQTSYDAFSAHAFTETWLNKNLMFSTGYSYSDLASSLGGSQIYGSDFDVGYVPGLYAGLGYSTLGGDARLYEYVTDFNLFYRPTTHLTITPSLRVQEENTDESVNGLETDGLNAAAPFSAVGNSTDLDVRERLDVTYNGLTNWVFYARGDLSEGNGNMVQDGGLVPIGGFGPAPVQEQIQNQRFFQKYSAGARWYPLRAVTVDAGGYYKKDSYNYGNNVDSTLNNLGSFNSYPGFLVEQGFETYDGNLRVTLRPWRKVTLASRYEYQLSTIDTAPDPVSTLPEVQSSRMYSHILAQDVTWSPWTRLSLQAGINYVISKTTTPASSVAPAILDADNNYWMANLSSGFVVDDKTDLNLSYFYYRANDYQDNSTVGVPYGAGGEDQGLTAALVRRLTKQIRVSLKYGWYHGSDDLAGGMNNYSAQYVYSTVQYRF